MEVIYFVRLPPECIDGIHWGSDGPSGRSGALGEPRDGHPIPLIFLPDKQDAETPTSIGGARASVGRARRLHLYQGRCQLSCVKKRPGMNSTFDLRSDRSNDLKSGIKRVLGIVLGRREW